MTSKQLNHRLNRAMGQIEAIKGQIEPGKESDCLIVLQQLKASINALKKFGEAYMSEHLEDCLEKGKSSKQMEDTLKSIITGAFSL